MLTSRLVRVWSHTRPAGSVCWRARPTPAVGRDCVSYSPRRLATGPADAKPHQEGFFAPAEFSPHACCLIGWAWNEQVWPWRATRVKKAGRARTHARGGGGRVLCACVATSHLFIPERTVTNGGLLASAYLSLSRWSWKWLAGSLRTERRMWL